MTTGIVIHKPLFQPTDLIEAVRDLPLPTPSPAAAETVAQDLTTDISLSLNEQQVSDSRLARGARMERLAAIDKAASRLLEELGYPTDLEAAQGWNAACPVGALLAPGLMPPPDIAATLRLQAVLGGTQSLLDRAEEARELAELCGTPDEAPSAVRHAISRALAEAALRILPEAVAVLLAVTHAAQAQVANEPKKKGDRLDVAAPRVMQVTAAAFMRLFGKTPEPRVKEYRDAPAVIWIKRVLEAGATRAEEALGNGSPEADLLRYIADLSHARLSDRLAGVLRRDCPK